MDIQFSNEEDSKRPLPICPTFFKPDKNKNQQINALNENLPLLLLDKPDNLQNDEILFFLAEVDHSIDALYYKTNKVLKESFGDEWSPVTYKQLLIDNFAGFTGYFFSKISTFDGSLDEKINLSNYLMDIDKTYGTNWKRLRENSRILKKILESDDANYVQATAVCDNVLGNQWNYGWTYDYLRSKDFYGYTHYYLEKSVNFEQFTSSATVSVLLQLARIDLEFGTTVSEIVFNCCLYYPTTESIMKLITLCQMRTDIDDKTIIEQVLNFEDEQEYTCLMAIFQMAVNHRNQSNQTNYNALYWIHKMEKCIQYLIDFARAQSLNLAKFLNKRTKTGTTLFFYASMFSEKISCLLLRENVNVNSVDHKFVTPFFKVSLKLFWGRSNF